MRHIVRALVETVIVAVLLFVSAGRVGLPAFATFCALILASKLTAAAVLDHSLLDARSNPGADETDHGFMRAFTAFSFAGLIAAGLDVGRLHWMEIPGASGIGIVCLALCLCLSISCMKYNEFFLPTIRIQSERRHRLVTTGPYETVRHPGNLATIGVLLSTGFALGSGLSVLVHLPLVLLMIRRTLREDRFLAQRLDGYDLYMENTRWRLIPGVW